MQRLVILFSSLLSFAILYWSLAASTVEQRHPASLPTVPNCHSLSSQGFNIDRFLEEIQRRQLSSVEDVICLIPSVHRNNYVLVHSSDSAQSSRPTHPRAIIFSAPERNGRHTMDFAISFNGHPDDTNFQNVEIMRANRTPRSGRPHFEFIDIHCQGGDACRISPPNPQECRMCHQINASSPRPIWDAKGFFPQVYGRSAFGGSIAQEGEQAENFLNFQSIAEDHPRYGLLGGVERHHLINGTLPTLIRANSVFSEGLSSVNNLRIAELIIATENYQSYKYAILASLLNCENIPDFVPQSLWLHHTNLRSVETEFRDPNDYGNILIGYERLNAITNRQPIPPDMSQRSPEPARDSMPQFIIDQPRQIQPFLHDLHAKRGGWGDAVDSIASTRWLIEGRGIPMVEWAMDVPNAGRFSAYRFMNNRSSEWGPETQTHDTWAIAAELTRRDNQLSSVFIQGSSISLNHLERQLLSGREPRMRHDYCQTLKRYSLRALENLTSNSHQQDIERPSSRSRH
jgi:hypothetical protein